MNNRASKFYGLKLILVVVVVNLEIGDCYKCNFAYHWRSGYNCNITPDSRGIEEKHYKNNTNHDVSGIYFNGDLNGVSHLTNSELAPICRKFENLKTIYVNDVGSVDDKLFQGCKNLKNISISNSEITDMSEKLFLEQPELTSIFINEIKISSLPENIFMNQKELQHLFLEQNQISCLPPNIFKSLTMLSYLDLSENKIESLNPIWFENIESLTELYLNGNKIRDLPQIVFAYLDKLETLSLRDNQLTTIHSDSFGTHRSLHYVILRNNKINAIDKKVIDNVEVSKLDMSRNVCCNEQINCREELTRKLSNCFKNIQPRQDSSSVVLTVNRCPQSTKSLKSTIECGTRANFGSNHQGSDHGETLIDHGEYPWNVALIKSSGVFLCGGTLVSGRHVVTAATCFQSKYDNYEFEPEDITVMLGVHNLKKEEEVGRILAGIKSINVHRSWNTDKPSIDADIAILELLNEVQFDNYIRPICLADEDSDVAKVSIGTVVDFGQTENGTPSGIANKLDISIYDFHNCASTSYDQQTFANPRTFCGGAADGICNGDSGSGVYVLYNETFYLRGLVSSLANNQSDCDNHQQAVFTDVTQYYDWIKRGGLKRIQIRTKRFSFI